MDGTEENDVSWTPIAGNIQRNDGVIIDYNTGFSGIFNGNGKTISELYINKSEDTLGLFGKIVDGGKVNNLIVTGNIKGNNIIGGICASIKNGELQNCRNEVNITATGYHVGGIVGYIDVGNKKVIIESCSNLGNISSTNGNIGGIAGTMETLNIIRSCYNLGSVSGSSNVAGIVGTAVANGKNTKEKFIYNSYNNGSITANSGGNVGGIIGYTGITNVYYCVNVTSEIKAGTNNGGSIIGKTFGSYYSYDGIYYCYYNGNLSIKISGKNTIQNCTSFKDEIDKQIMLQTLNTGLQQIEYNGNMVDVWKITTENNGYPILYWE